jgi:hypothetical protein
MTNPTHEKIETIVDCFLTDRTRVGTMGSLIERAPGRYRVYADGKCFTVKSTKHGWEVKFNRIAAIDGSLIEAARLCINNSNFRTA